MLLIKLLFVRLAAVESVINDMVIIHRVAMEYSDQLLIPQIRNVVVRVILNLTQIFNNSLLPFVILPR